MPPFGAEFFGGRDELEVSAGNVFELVRLLDAIGPGFAEIAGIRIALAVDGILASDWSMPLSDSSEVLVVPRIAGGIFAG